MGIATPRPWRASSDFLDSETIKHLESQIAQHMKRPSPWTVPTLAQRVLRGGDLLDDRRGDPPEDWSWCLVAVVLLGEFLVCAKDGGTFRDARWREETEVIALNLLRDAVLHPAFHDAGKGAGNRRAPIDRLAEHLAHKTDEPALGERLLFRPADLLTRPFAEFGLRQLRTVIRNHFPADGR